MEDRKTKSVLVKKENKKKMNSSKNSAQCTKKKQKVKKGEAENSSDQHKNKEENKYDEFAKKISQGMESYDKMLNQICKQVTANQTILKTISPYIVTNSDQIKEILKVQNLFEQKLINQETQSTQSLNEMITELEEDLEVAQNTIDLLNEEKRKLMSEKTYTLEKIKELTKDNSQLTEEIAQLKQEIKTLAGNYHQQELMREQAEQKLNTAEHDSKISVLKAVIKNTEEEYQIIETELNNVNVDNKQSVNYVIEDCKNFFKKYLSVLNENGFYEIGQPGGHDYYDPEIHFLIEGKANEGDYVYIQDIGWRIENEIYKRAGVLKEDED